MKNMLLQVLHSGKFVTGFVIFVALILFVLIYPLFVTDSPLAIIGEGTFFPPGVYVNAYDSVNTNAYTLNLTEATDKRIADKLGEQQRLDMQTWLIASGIPETQINPADTAGLLDLWQKNYDPKKTSA